MGKRTGDETSTGSSLGSGRIRSGSDGDIPGGPRSRWSDEERRNAALAARWFEEIWNQRRVATVHELWSEGAIAHMEGFPSVTKEDFLAFHEQLIGGFSDLRLDVSAIVPRGDQVSIEWCLTGTHDGPFLGIQPSGRSVEAYGVTRLRFVDGKMAEGRDHWNMGAMLDRLARPSADEVIQRHGLTERQAEVALLLADGHSAKGIAKRLGIAVNTARRHTQAIFRRLDVHSRSEVADRLGRVKISLSGPHVREE